MPSRSTIMYKATIRNNTTKEIRVHEMDLEWHEASYFWWDEGNFSCDCNREWEFQRAGGEPVSDDPECGDERYSVLYIDLEDGERIVIDGE